jgi:hypothetical protein
MLSSSLQAWAEAFGLTLAVELPTAWLLLRKHARPLPLFAVAALASAITHPVFWLLATRRSCGYWSFTAAGETLVTLVEAGVLALLLRPGIRRAIACSAAMNAASFLAGLALRALGWL